MLFFFEYYMKSHPNRVPLIAIVSSAFLPLHLPMSKRDLDFWLAISKLVRTGIRPNAIYTSFPYRIDQHIIFAQRNVVTSMG